MAKTMSKEKDFYYARVKCSNCNYGYPYDDDMKVPKGITFKEFAKVTPCSKCGCKGTLYYYG